MLGAIVLPIMAGAPTRSKSLQVGGLDMVLKPGPPGNNYGVPIESVSVREAGPNGVSDMSFAINDPLSEVTLLEGLPVVFWDHVRDAPIFSGFLQSWSYSPEGIGRNIAVMCIGIDAVLDWMKIGSLTIPAGTRIENAIQSCYAAAYGVGVSLNFAINPGSQRGTLGLPMADQWDAMLYDIVISNATLREAISQCLDGYAYVGHFRIVFWVDFYGGFRTLYDTASVPIPLDYQNITVTDRPGGALVATGLQYTFDATATPHQVLVVGATPSGSALVSDGSAIPGPIAQLQDQSSTDQAHAQSIGLGYLADLRSTVRGSFILSAFNPALGPGPGANQRAGTSVVIIDDNIGLAGTVFRSSAISKTFNPSGTEEWTVSFGGQAPSAIRLNRRLTRGTLS